MNLIVWSAGTTCLMGAIVSMPYEQVPAEQTLCLLPNICRLLRLLPAGFTFSLCVGWVGGTDCLEQVLEPYLGWVPEQDGFHYGVFCSFLLLDANLPWAACCWVSALRQIH